MKSIFYTALCFLLTGISSGQITPAIVNSATSPIQLVSINSTVDDFLHEVTVKNASSRPVTSFRLGLITAIPSGCGTREIFNAEQILRNDEVQLPPAEYMKTVDYTLSPASFVRFASDNLGVVLSQLTVVHVQFSDGSTWDFPKSGKSYDDALLSANATMQCVHSSRAGFSQVKASLRCGGGWIKTAQTNPDRISGYQCTSGSQQSCTNSNDGLTCTSSICQSGAGCPQQTCSVH